MSTQTENQLRDLFDFDAAHAPTAQGLAAGARYRAGRQRQARLAGAAGVAVVVLLAAGTFSATHDWVVRGDTRPQAGPSTSPLGGVGPLPDGAAAGCVESYSPAAVSGRAFAFDGTVTNIGPARTNRPGVELDLANVTFRVNQWFQGGDAATVAVDMTAPDARGITFEGGPSYGLGTRLLVSGEPRWGGNPLDNAIAWGCGFTRYYAPSEASQWAGTTR